MKKVEPKIFKSKEWKTLMNLPDYPLFQVVPKYESPYEKKMAKIMQKFIDYSYMQAKGSVILKTPFGVLMWSPK